MRSGEIATCALPALHVVLHRLDGGLVLCSTEWRRLLHSLPEADVVKGHGGNGREGVGRRAGGRGGAEKNKVGKDDWKTNQGMSSIMSWRSSLGWGLGENNRFLVTRPYGARSTPISCSAGGVPIPGTKNGAFLKRLQPEATADFMHVPA